MLHDALYSQNSLKNFSSKIAWVWLTYIWPFLYYKKTILEWNSGNFWRKIFEGILWIRGIMEHQLRPPRGFVDIFNPFSLKNLESHTVNPKIFTTMGRDSKHKSWEVVPIFYYCTIFLICRALWKGICF